ncbi:60S ribosomal protein L28-like [Echinops telfairi]|uniref:60S ribosomal protein L28-like n=1 Tax=Echinops telfairi TaxID=9371 RepID=A0AC55DQA5_ECHTE|nr:60S ribosomal protein L28-like [Echinops telfairi]
MSVHLQWMVGRKCSSFLIKRNEHIHSIKPNNLNCVSTLLDNKLLHPKTRGFQPAADGKGLMVVLKPRQR